MESKLKNHLFSKNHYPSANYKGRVMEQHSNNSTRKGMKEYSDRLQYSDRFKYIILLFKMTSSQTRCTTRILLVRNFDELFQQTENVASYTIFLSYQLIIFY